MHPQLLFSGVGGMVRAITIEGIILGILIVADGIYVAAFPPANDEPQGYAIIAIGIFIILIILHLNNRAEDGECPPM
jgi:Mg2+ and Co2+ transporter CorA